MAADDLHFPDAAVSLRPDFLSPTDADRLLAALRDEVRWEQRTIRLFGREVAQPRLVSWHGDPGCSYTYSGLTLSPKPWTPALGELRTRVAETTGLDHDCVLANLYRGGEDSMGMHADDEPELGPEPHIASVSLGAERRLVLHHRTRRDLRFNLTLPPGSLLVMAGRTQTHYRHGLPKTRKPVGVRINLTFRRIAVLGDG